MANDYAGQILESLDYVIKARLKEQKFDETIICTVVDDTKASEGLYVVSDGTIKFDAYSESVDYKVDQAVRVNVPKGDYSQKKYIVGKAVSEKNGNQPIVYSAPSTQILDLTGNIVPKEEPGKGWSIFANGEADEKQVFKGKGESTYVSVSTFNLNEYQGLIYDTLYLKADFKTIFGQRSMCAGGYGLLLTATMKSKNSSGKQNTRTYYLDSKQMFGNPYNYLISSSQETKFFIGKDDGITNIGIVLYQTGDFQYRDSAGNIRPYEKSIAPEIAVSNVYIGLGVDLTQVEDNKVEIQCTDSPYYNDPKADTVDNTKIIRLQWYNKDENNQYIGFSDGEVEKTSTESELDYAKRLSEHNRIVAQMGKDGVPDDYAGFELNARYEEIKDLKTTLINLINIDLYSEIKDLQYALNGKASSEFTNWLNELKGANGDAGIVNDIILAFNGSEQKLGLLEFYKNGLDFAKKVQDGLVTVEEGKYIIKGENETSSITITKPFGLRKIENKLLGRLSNSDEYAYLQSENYLEILDENNSYKPLDQLTFDPVIESGYLIDVINSIENYMTDIKAVIISDVNLSNIYNGYKTRINKIKNTIIKEKDRFKALSLGHLYSINSRLDNSDETGSPVNYYTSWYLFEDPLHPKQINLKDEDGNLDPKSGQGLLTSRILVNDSTKQVSLFPKRYYPDKFDKQSNLYSIYWYYYRDGYKAGEGENYLGGDNWCEITDPGKVKGKPRFNVINTNDNIGLPEPILNEITGKQEYPKKPEVDDENGYLTISFSKERPDVKEEKIKAILIYDHEKYESNVLTFENRDPAAGPELANNIQIVHGSNSQAVYPLYGVDNTLIKASDENTKRQLKVQYLNERGEPESGNDGTVLKGASIYWYVPTQATMLRTEDIDLVNASGNEENFTKGSMVKWNFDVVPTMATENGKDQYVDSCKLIYTTERPVFKKGNDYFYIYQGTEKNSTWRKLTDGGVVTVTKDNDIPVKVTITYEYNYNRNDEYGKFYIYTYNGTQNGTNNADNWNIVTPLSYGGITYSISEDGNYIINSNNDKYYIGSDNKITLEVDTPDENDQKGYDYYYKRIEDVDDLTFTYRIKNYYSSGSTNNTIKCKVVKGNQTLESSINLDFNSHGSNGTNYSLVVKPLPLTTEDIYYDNETSLIVNKRAFEVMLFDYENKQIPFKQTPTVSLLGGGDKPQISLEPKTSNETGVLSYITNEIDIPHYNYHPWFLKVEANQPWPLDSNTLVTLETQYPIPLSNSIELIPGPYQGDIPTTIVYDSLGGTPSYYKNPLALYDKNGELIQNCKWSILYFEHQKNGETITVTRIEPPVQRENETDDDFDIRKKAYSRKINFLPKLQGEANGVAKLVPSTMYVDDDHKICAVLKCGTADNNNYMRWLQPLLICQNRYPSAMLNNWDGGLKIDEGENTILANIVGAGKKENDNSFSGVLMGEVENAKVPTDTARNDLQHPHTGLGLYGFHHGEQSFGFNVNGTAFIGKSGSGRIAFDGTRGIIHSGNWLYDNRGQLRDQLFDENNELIPGSQGMAIDLQNGHIDAYNFKLTSDGIQLNSSPDEGEDYIYIGPNDSTQPHIRYAKGGELEIAVNSLAITGVVGGSNLLNNTAPKEALHLPPGTQSGDHIALERWHSIPKVDDEGTNGQNQRCITKISRSNNGKSWIIMDNHLKEDGTEDQTQTLRTLYQYIDPSDNKDSVSNFSKGKYTLSGTIYSGASRKVIFHLGNWSSGKGMVSSTEILVNGGYKSFHHTFDITSDNVPKIFWISDLYNGDPDAMVENVKMNTLATYFNHLKLEKGTIVTPWDESDVDGYTLSVADQINQDIVFNKLTNNGETKGIWLTNNQLYINATYISSGILRSNNWNGVFKKGNQQITSSDYENLSNADKANVTISAYTQGTYMNLNTGEFYIGQDSGSYIRYENGSLKIKVNEFSLTSGAIGGQNLLNNTAPKEALDLSPGTQPTNQHVSLQGWHTLESDQKCRTNVSRTLDGKSWIIMGNTLTDQRVRTLYHYLDPQDNSESFGMFTPGKYTLSGTIYSNGPRKVVFRLGQWNTEHPEMMVSSSAFEIQEGNYVTFHYTFNITSNNVPKIFWINDQYNGSSDKNTANLVTWFHHLKLEKGTVVTPWNESDIDYYYNSASNQLTQEIVFNKLTNNGTVQGIFLSNNQLYINATYINSGALTVAKGSDTVFSADVDEGTVQMAGWSVTSNAISKSIIRDDATDSPYYWISMSAPTSYENASSSAFLVIKHWEKVDGKEIATFPFYVRHNGKLVATNVDIKGKITATSGTIGGCTINSGDIKGDNWKLTSSNIKLGNFSINAFSGLSGSGIALNPGVGVNFTFGTTSSSPSFHIDYDGIAIYGISITKDDIQKLVDL